MRLKNNKFISFYFILMILHHTNTNLFDSFDDLEISQKQEDPT